MHMPYRRGAFIITWIVLALVLATVVINGLIIVFNGSRIAVPGIPRGAETYGQGKPLTYVVLGDSTTVSQGGDYDRGYVRTTARFLAGQGYRVTLHNLGVSGARAEDVMASQTPEAVKLHPDVALISVGANDVTHMTGIGSVEDNVSQSISALRSANPAIQIIYTGSPQMGSIPRFPQPTRYLATLRTQQLNTMARRVAADKHVIFAPIAEKTGPAFSAHPELYAADKFHPNTDGYDLWSPVLNDALRQALK
jgi:acyl-CoA thioesterase-1